jgi:ParB-like chromosome segregation protein Spo0J
MSELAVHPVAALFPMLADDELEELAASIKARGLRFPIIRDKEGSSMGAIG